jgi:hypothetical protein
MQTMVRGFVLALTAGVATLTLVACDKTSTPATPSAEATTSATSTGSPTTSITVRGSVVDSENRLLPNMAIECLGDVICEPSGFDVTTAGHQHRVENTDSNGSFSMVAIGHAGSRGSFLVNANGAGYQVGWRQVEWPDASCTSDRCTVTVDFKLTSVAD